MDINNLFCFCLSQGALFVPRYQPDQFHYTVWVELNQKHTWILNPFFSILVSKWLTYSVALSSFILFKAPEYKGIFFSHL